jgi:hypothetical protein
MSGTTFYRLHFLVLLWVASLIIKSLQIPTFEAELSYEACSRIGRVRRDALPSRLNTRHLRDTINPKIDTWIESLQEGQKIILGLRKEGRHDSGPLLFLRRPRQLDLMLHSLIIPVKAYCHMVDHVRYDPEAGFGYV